MKIIKLLPYGFCFGVINSYQQSKKIIQNNLNKKIYMLGWIVHNEQVVKEFQELGVIVLDDKNISRENLIKQYIQEPSNAILILSAHGTAKSVIEFAKSIGLEVYDLTCKYVYKSHNIILKKLKDNYQILFIGKKNHPETNAILAIDNSIQLIENVNDIKNISASEKMFCTNQTTLGPAILDDIFKAIKIQFSNIETENDICDATKRRQSAIINMPTEVDICLIIGDTRSSNCNELYNLAKDKVFDTYIVDTIININPNWFVDKNCCAISAAASTPNYIIEAVIDYLNQLNNVSHIF